MTKKLIIILIIYINVSFYLSSNDGSYTHGAGGVLIPIKNNNISMVEEEINISIEKLSNYSYIVNFHCKFLFKNKTDNDQKVTMGFPVKYGINWSINEPSLGPKSVINFKTIIGNEELETKKYYQGFSTDFDYMNDYLEVYVYLYIVSLTDSSFSSFPYQKIVLCDEIDWNKLKAEYLKNTDENNKIFLSYYQFDNPDFKYEMLNVEEKIIYNYLNSKELSTLSLNTFENINEKYETFKCDQSLYNLYNLKDLLSLYNKKTSFTDKEIDLLSLINNTINDFYTNLINSKKYSGKILKDIVGENNNFNNEILKKTDDFI